MRHDLNTPTRFGDEWVFPSGDRLPVITGGDGDDVDPAAVDATPDADAPVSEAFTVPENLADPEAHTDDALTALADDLAGRYDPRFAELTADGATPSMADVEVLRSWRDGFYTVHAELGRRAAERQAILDGLAALAPVPAADPEPQPSAAPAPAADAPVAIAAAVRATIAAPATVADDAGQPAPAATVRTAAQLVEERSANWMLQNGQLGDRGGPVSFRRLVNDTRPSRSVSLERQEVPETVLAAYIESWDEGADVLGESPAENEAILFRAIERHAAERQAAAADMPGVRSAAICTPSTIFRDASVCGVTDTPFQNALVKVNAGSGNQLSMQYRQSTLISAAGTVNPATHTSSVGVWTSTLQGSVDPADPTTWKPCATIACPSYVTKTASEITACYTIDAFTELSSPEAEADFVQAMDRLWARTTEAWYLREAQQYLSHYSLNVERGSVPALIEAILTTRTYGMYPERLDDGGYIVFGTPGILENGVIDLNSRAFADPRSAYSEADVIGTIRTATGNDYVELNDVPMTSGGLNGTNPFPTLATPSAGSSATALTTSNRMNSVTYSLFVIDPSSIPIFGTGEAIFGQQMTLEQARQNVRGFFKRTFGGMMNRGCYPGFQIDLTICPDGSRGGFTDPGCPPTSFTGTAGAGVTSTPPG